MPARNVKRAPRRTPFRKYRRRNYRRKPITSRVPRNRFMVAVPQSMPVRLHSVRTGVINNLTANPNWVIINANSLQDVWSISGTQQPYLRDQMFTLYNNARVIKFSFVLKLYGIYQQNPIEVVLATTKDGTQDTDMEVAKIRKYSRSAIMTDSRVRVLKQHAYVDQYFGHPKGTVYKEDDFLVSDGVDLGTSQKCYYQFLIKDLSGALANAVPAVYYEMHLNQWTRFENPKDQALS